MQVVPPSLTGGFRIFRLSLSLCRLVRSVFRDRAGDGRRNLKKHGKGEKI